MDTGFNIFEPQPRLQSIPPPSHAPAATLPRRWWRRTLLASAAVLAVAGGVGAFVVSPYNHLFPIKTGLRVDTGNPGSPVREPVAENPAPAVLAPAARMAGTPRQEAKPAVRGSVAPVDPDAQTREILALRGGSDRQPAAAKAGVADTVGGPTERAANPSSPTLPGPAAVPAWPSTAEVGASPPVVLRPASPALLSVTPSPPPAGTTAMEPGMAAPVLAPATPPVPAPHLSTPTIDPARGTEEADPADAPPQKQAVTDSSEKVTPAPPAPSASTPSAAATATASSATPATSDAVGTAIALRPNVMARGEQVDVLHLVAQLGTMIRDLRSENAGLRASTKATSDKVDTAVADFERRLALSEGRGAIRAATADMDAPTEPSAAAPSASRMARRARAAAPQPPIAQDAPSIAAPVGAVRYKVQAASPGLAMLSELDRSGGDGSQLQVKVGDQLPGYGRVMTIQQQGMAWTVKTEHGAIQ